MISIVIPLYNKENQIQKTLETVFVQTFKDFEVVIVNDGSTDKSVEKVKEYCCSHNIQLIEATGILPNTSYSNTIRLVNQSNSGVSAARNKGIEQAQFDYVALLDADDEWKPDYLQTQVNLIKKYPEASVFATNYEFKNEKGEIKPTKIRKLPFEGEDGLLSNYFEVASFSHPPICSINIVAKKEAFQSIGGFPLGIKSGEDLITWAKLVCKFKIVYSKSPLVFFCESPSSSNKPKSQERAGGEDYVLQELLKLYEKNNDIPFLKEYIHRWYKIYCVLLIENLQNKKVLTLAFEAIKFGGRLSHFIPLSLFSFLTKSQARKLFLKLRR